VPATSLKSRKMAWGKKSEPVARLANGFGQWNANPPEETVTTRSREPHDNE
jgi:hypothetical protein